MLVSSNSLQMIRVLTGDVDHLLILAGHELDVGLHVLSISDVAQRIYNPCTCFHLPEVSGVHEMTQG